jgi:hypothetical protein
MTERAPLSQRELSTTPSPRTEGPPPSLDSVDAVKEIAGGSRFRAHSTSAQA